MNAIERLYRTAPDAAGFARGYVGYMAMVLGRIDPKAVEALIEELEAARRQARTVFFAGNGGSASTASHFANDLAKAARVDGEPGFRTVSLVDNSAVMTALANDEGYESVFTGQMRDLFGPGDVLVAISASGNSPNVIAALKLAKQLGGRTVGIVGFDGGALRSLCDLVVHVPSEPGEYGPVEDAHLVVNHLIADYLRMQHRASRPVGR